MVSRWLTVTCVALFAGTILLSTGCGGGGKTELRVLQASPDENTGLNFLIDSNTLFSNVALDAPSSYAGVSGGSRHLQVEPNGSTTNLIDETISVASGTHYTLITADFAANITPFMLTDDTTAPASGNFKVRVVNAGVGAGTVDAYVVTPGTLPGSVAPTFSGLTFKNSSGYQSLTAGSYEVFFTLSGVPSVTYVDTGSLSFADQQNRTIVLVPTSSGSFSYVVLSDLN
jgi:hypothetical protein